jgi:DNA repair exonuclease SbcCD ATPase subunit
MFGRKEIKRLNEVLDATRAFNVRLTGNVETLKDDTSRLLSQLKAAERHSETVCAVLDARMAALREENQRLVKALSEAESERDELMDMLCEDDEPQLVSLGVIEGVEQVVPLGGEITEKLVENCREWIARLATAERDEDHLLHELGVVLRERNKLREEQACTQRAESATCSVAELLKGAKACSRAKSSKRKETK